MPEYRVYTITAGDHIDGPAKIIECDSDTAAVEQARGLIDGPAIEVWDGARRIARMGQILKFIPSNANLDSETVAILGTAFDNAIAALHDTGQPEIVREAIARRIISVRGRGRTRSRAIVKCCAGLVKAATLTLQTAPILPCRDSKKPPRYSRCSGNEKGPICIGPLDLFLLLALRVSLITVLASSLGMLLGIC
ncbi:MAG: hypothetical protein WB774_01690 [Xanthobacteraceae bacterium]